MTGTTFEFESNSLADTDRLGQSMGRALEPGTAIGLDGTLGAGKTRLTQAIGIGLEVAPNQIVSPTFTIMVPHAGRLPLAHLDAYRIGGPEEVDELGLDEMIVDGVVLIVEWSQRIGGLLPPLDVQIEIEHVADQRRRFQLVSRSTKGQTLLGRVRNEV